MTSISVNTISLLPHASLQLIAVVCASWFSMGVESNHWVRFELKNAHVTPHNGSLLDAVSVVLSYKKCRQRDRRQTAKPQT